MNNKRVDTFKNRLSMAMNSCGINTTELAEKTGYSKASISQWVNGIYEAKQDGVYQLAQALNVSEAWLMGYDVPMAKKIVRISPNYSSELSEIINYYEKLNDDGREQAYIALRNLADIDRYLLKRDSLSALVDTNAKKA
ncbi:MAG: helix-turn-helix domain-containing protein [Lachnospiraceae bacterium]|nr:helix-turn-helix domain-containing protein [Lachnospiraceae bacterium]